MRSTPKPAIRIKFPATLTPLYRQRPVSAAPQGQIKNVCDAVNSRIRGNDGFCIHAPFTTKTNTAQKIAPFGATKKGTVFI